MYGPLGFGLRITIYLLRASRRAKWSRGGISENEVGELAEDTAFERMGAWKAREAPEEPIVRSLRNLLMSGIRYQPIGNQVEQLMMRPGKAYNRSEHHLSSAFTQPFSRGPLSFLVHSVLGTPSWAPPLPGHQLGLTLWLTLPLAALAWQRVYVSELFRVSIRKYYGPHA